MNKPENYAYYSNKKNNIPFSEWPIECKNYKYWKRDILRHPEWKDLSDEEYLKAKKESKRIRGIKAAKVMRIKVKNKTPEEISDINKRKGNGYNKLSPEEKEKRNKELSNISKVFWDSMSEEERKEFGKYRWDLKSDEEKQIIVTRFNQAGINRMKNMPKEEIDQIINNMNQARLRKLEEDAEFREKQIEMLRKHNREYFDNLSKEEKINILKHNQLNQKFEFRFHNTSMLNGFYYERELKINAEGNLKFWDYAIYEKETKNIVMVVDLDGSFFHGDNSDYNGLHSKESRDEKRGEFVDDGVKIQIITENNFDKDFNDMINNLHIEYQDYLNKIFNDMRSIEFPYPHYTHNELVNSYRQLLRLDPDKDKLTLSIRNREGDRLINHFHHSIYHAHRSGKPSPYDAWYNDDLLMKCILNRTIYRSLIDKNKILQGFNVSKIAPKVSVFSAGRAKLIIYKYLNDYDTIFDPFSGFSGRMLGALSMNKYYIGRDISHTHILESISLVNFLDIFKDQFPNFIYPNLDVSDAELNTGRYECLFTCPPYGTKEIWKGEIKNYHSCDEWIDICIENYKCSRYLFIVDNTLKYKGYIEDVIINKSHFGKNYEYIVII